jgi:hypothetical protein
MGFAGPQAGYSHCGDIDRGGVIAQWLAPDDFARCGPRASEAFAINSYAVINPLFTDGFYDHT